MTWRERLKARAHVAESAGLQNLQNTSSEGFVGIQTSALQDFCPPCGEKSGEPSSCEPAKPTQLAAPESAEQALPSVAGAQEKARRAVLTRLEAEPDIERAFVSRWDGDVMLITLAVRDVGTCELAIPAERFSENSLTDYDRLAACIVEAT